MNWSTSLLTIDNQNHASILNKVLWSWMCSDSGDTWHADTTAFPNLIGTTISLIFITLAVLGVLYCDIKPFSSSRHPFWNFWEYPKFLNYFGSIGVYSGSDKKISIYIRSWSYSVACLHSSSMGIHSAVASFIYPSYTISVGVSPLSFNCFVAVYPWCIYTDIAFRFISASSSASMRDAIPCFPGTTLSCITYTSYLSIDRCSTICCRITRYINNLCILICLHLPPEKYFPPIHIPESLLKNPHVGLIPQSTVLVLPYIIPDGKILQMIYV